MIALISMTGNTMTVGAWDPNQSEQSMEHTIDQQNLLAFIALSEQDQLEALENHLDDALIAASAPLMTLGKKQWFAAAESLSEEQIVHLIRFFTLAEMQLSGWQAGSESPVIWLTKVLRQRKAPLDKAMLLWIRANSDNRFLPNGAL